MSKSTNRKSVNEKLKERLAEKERAMDILRKEMEEKEKAFEKRMEDELGARCVEKTTVTAIDISGEIGNISDVSTKSQGTQIEQIKLVAGQKVNCNLFVTQVLFPEIKILDDDTFKENPKILDEALKKMGVESEREKLQLSEATKREIKYRIAHRRSYCKIRHAAKYKGKICWMTMHDSKWQF